MKQERRSDLRLLSKDLSELISGCAGHTLCPNDTTGMANTVIDTGYGRLLPVWLSWLFSMHGMDTIASVKFPIKRTGKLLIFDGFKKSLPNVLYASNIKIELIR